MIIRTLTIKMLFLGEQNNISLFFLTKQSHLNTLLGLIIWTINMKVLFLTKQPHKFIIDSTSKYYSNNLNYIQA